MSRSILVVEDNQALRRMMCVILEQCGLQPLPAESAKLGLKLVGGRSGDISLAILDMVMPGMSGLDLAAELSRDFPNIPILYISGHTDSLAMQSIASLKPENVLLKPFTPAALMDRIGRLLGTPVTTSSASAGQTPGD